MRITVERGQQRYCLHHFTGGACVMCHYNPWKRDEAKPASQSEPLLPLFGTTNKEQQ